MSAGDISETATSGCLFYSETQRRCMGTFVKPLLLMCFNVLKGIYGTKYSRTLIL